MRSGQDVLEQALRLLNYTDVYGQIDTQQNVEFYKRGLAAVNQIYSDLWFSSQTDPFFPLISLKESILLPARQVVDVMPFGVAMLLALSEGDGDNQQLYAALYNRKRTVSLGSRWRKNVLFCRNKEGKV
jgi:hypothetical protein